jgi:phosphate/sulfate permease
MTFDSMLITLFAAMTIAAFICVGLNIKGQQVIMTTHERVITLITTFRKELHQAIEEALSQHIQEYHK